MSDQTGRIPFNKPYFTGKEVDYIRDAVKRGHISGNGHYSKECQNYFEENYGFEKCLLTTSCTDALEMCAILLDIQPGDEVIMPSFTFVSTANAFVLRGAKIVFCDSRPDHPGIDEEKIERLITEKTKVIVPVHYAGVACDMDKIMSIAEKHNLYVVEDAAQAVDSYYNDKPLGGIGHLGTYSFHETKNIISGEGGMLIINDKRFEDRAEIIWEKGTNRTAFFRGEVDKYGWVDQGSSFLPSDMNAAVLWSQIEDLQDIQNRRLEIWKRYDDALLNFSDKVRTPYVPDFATNNAHMYYLVFQNVEERNLVIQALKEQNVHTVFHYQSLHDSEFMQGKYKNARMPNTEIYSDCLLRLPFYYELDEKKQNKVIKALQSVIRPS